MKNNRIFALETILEDSLYAIKYNTEENNEFNRLFNDWSDIEFLEAFFEEHKNDLQRKFYNNISIEKAIENTIDEANKLEQKLMKIAKSGKTNNYHTLQTIFKPLNNNNEYPFPEYQKSKVYGDKWKSWLRIYAIRLEPNVFVITGGAIKLTRTMNEREHLLNELQKLEQTKQYLIEQGVIDNSDIINFLEI